MLNGTAIHTYIHTSVKKFYLCPRHKMPTYRFPALISEMALYAFVSDIAIAGNLSEIFLLFHFFGNRTCIFLLSKSVTGSSFPRIGSTISAKSSPLPRIFWNTPQAGVEIIALTTSRASATEWPAADMPSDTLDTTDCALLLIKSTPVIWSISSALLHLNRGEKEEPSK